MCQLLSTLCLLPSVVIIECNEKVIRVCTLHIRILLRDVVKETNYQLLLVAKLLIEIEKLTHNTYV